MPVSRLQQEMSSREFSEWIAFDRLDPIGGQRLDILFASLRATIAQCNRNKDVRFEDFLIDYCPEEKPLPTGSDIIRSTRALLGQKSK